MTVDLPSQNTIDMCKGGTVTSEKGIITSPAYPVAQPSKKCSLAIQVPKGKSLNVWLVDNKMNDRTAQGQCVADFLKINDVTVEETICGSERVNFNNEFCSDVLFLSYQSGTQVS